MTQPAPRSNTWITIVAIGAAATAFLAAVVLAAVYYWDRTPTPDGPPVTITACKHDGGETRIGFDVTNDGTEETSYRLRFRVLDADGKEISKGSEYTGRVDPGDTEQDAITLRHVGRVGATCEYLGVE
ncbi:hypothetical protein Cme02nite_38030 [Catellatospora methionotrophica]|uniref:Uncharacterized protein n=1 Tax=Catellatospora methionotrophica TaxID=121620 RepID=A0A8J3LHW7_9ACTN|nr:FxLYD domain-containing protein [Catellatospora methionotrophica]GIG15471.1 hypothetical protein Cme02nite_38030 [Catellatospora methionotrophica]